MASVLFSPASTFRIGLTGPLGAFPTESSDQINGSLWGDTILANGGDDVIDGHGGNDYINGGSGYDIAIYPGHSTDYILNQFDWGWEINGYGQTDYLVSIESVSFDSGFLFLDS